MPRAVTPGAFFMETSQLKIYDTTLRDGTQGEGIALSVTDKLLITERLDQFGIDYVEGGFPGSNPRDITFFAEVGKLKLRHARIAAFGSTRRAGVTADRDAQLKVLLDAGTPVVTIVSGARVSCSTGCKTHKMTATKPPPIRRSSRLP